MGDNDLWYQLRNYEWCLRKAKHWPTSFSTDGNQQNNSPTVHQHHFHLWPRIKELKVSKVYGSFLLPFPRWWNVGKGQITFYYGGWQTFSTKGQIINILGFVDYETELEILRRYLNKKRKKQTFKDEIQTIIIKFLENRSNNENRFLIWDNTDLSVQYFYNSMKCYRADKQGRTKR